MVRQVGLWLAALALVVGHAGRARAEGDWEVTPASQAALERGLKWLARHQGPQGNWNSENLGLVAMGALAFMADGHAPGRGQYGEVVERALDYILKSAKPSGLLNVAGPQRDMYNHGLSCFVLGQAHGMMSDPRISPALDRALKLIANTQCDDGGWEYQAQRRPRGHDLSLAVMQAKALRSAVDSGLEVPPEVIESAIKSVRRHYRPSVDGDRSKLDEQAMQRVPGQFTYTGNDRGTLAMAACGVVCLQEFGQYDDWRIGKNVEVISKAIKDMKSVKPNGEGPFDSYTTYYVGQAIYQVGGETWSKLYPPLRDALVASQVAGKDPNSDGCWSDNRRVGGEEGKLYATAVSCFVLAMPNRYLPILQEGRIDTLQKRFGQP
ncbi:MAG: terpene cyclase/mutase family protein [Planctomycetes bacterium]|nr:terpene cyclase/mutase family protein [Planctomycetota bacterium]